MGISLNQEEINILLTSLNYSKQHILDSNQTSSSIKQENLSRIEALAIKLRASRID